MQNNESSRIQNLFNGGPIIFILFNCIYCSFSLVDSGRKRSMHRVCHLIVQFLIISIQFLLIRLLCKNWLVFIIDHLWNFGFCFLSCSVLLYKSHILFIIDLLFFFIILVIVIYGFVVRLSIWIRIINKIFAIKHFATIYNLDSVLYINCLTLDTFLL